MYAAIAEIILANEKSDYRFELFCLAICGREEGITFVPTSTTWDMGRDGRAIGKAKGSHRNILCATLNRDLEPKVDADLLRVTASASPDRLIYCSSQKLSEHAANQIAAIIRRHVPNGSIEIFGAVQLAVLADKYKTVFEKYYSSELQDIRNNILNTEESTNSNYGLRLALLTLGNEDGISLRQEISELTVLDLLAAYPKSSAELSNSFVETLGLPVNLPSGYLDSCLLRLSDKGEILQTGGKWKLGSSGVIRHEALPVEAAKHLLEGRTVIRGQLETLIGQTLDNNQYAQIWSSLLDCVSTVFHASGLDIVLAMGQILGSEDGATESDTQDLRDLLTAGVTRAVSIITTQDLRDKVERGLLDILTERSGPAFDWLTRVSERFVVICSVGIEHSSSAAIKDVLAKHRVVLDSDIILDLLCDREPEHKVSVDVIRQWMHIGGRFLLSPVVLEEVAHHAWISDKDFRECEAIFSKIEKWEAKRYIKSAFVRTFFLRGIPLHHWGTFIGQFRGNSSSDYAKILRELRARIPGIEILPDNYSAELKGRLDLELANVRSFNNSDPEHVEDVDYKTERDGRLLASIAAARIAQQEAGDESRIILLSSARALRLVELKFKQEFGEERVVLSRKALTFLIASVPGVSLGADTLRLALFDFAAHAHLKQFERKALRLLRATNTYDMPWAGRTLLQRNLADAITAEASKRGVTPKVIKEEIKSGQDPDSSARVIIDTIVRSGITSDEAKRLEASEKKIRALESTISDLQIANKKLPK